jgi:hypothetical protein
MGKRARLLGMIGAVTTGLVVGLTALPATAAGGPGTSGRFGLEVQAESTTTVVPNFCGLGINVKVHDEIRSRGFFTFRGPQSIPYFTGTSHTRTTITEPNGTTVTISSNTVGKDQRIVVNGDLLTITGLGAGGFRIVGPAGALRNPGMIFSQVVIDTNGTLQDPFDDIFVRDNGLLRPSTGLNETSDLCTDYRIVTGRAA